MENKSFEEVIGSADAPFVNRLAAENTLVERQYAITHPSLPNYLALLGGDTFGITSDCTTCFVDAPNLVDALEAGGRTWTAYMEDLPSPCFLGDSAGGLLPGLLGRGGYALKHDPFLYFQDIRANPARCSHVVPLTQLDAALAAGRVPDFVWITPNLEHDTHDGPLSDGDSWLASLVPRIMASPAWRPGAWLIVTWDEGTTNAGCCGLAAGGHIATVIVRADGPTGVRVDQPTTHYTTLRTIEDVLNVAHVGKSAAPGVVSFAGLIGG